MKQLILLLKPHNIKDLPKAKAIILRLIDMIKEDANKTQHLIQRAYVCKIRIINMKKMFPNINVANNLNHQNLLQMNKQQPENNQKIINRVKHKNQHLLNPRKILPETKLLFLRSRKIISLILLLQKNLSKNVKILWDMLTKLDIKKSQKNPIIQLSTLVSLIQNVKEQ
jgi:hypothetical protein